MVSRKLITSLGAGVVVKVGSAVKNAGPGDKVLLSYNFCGDCDRCKEDHPAYCDIWAPLNFGGSRIDGTCSLSDANGTDVHCNFFGQSSFGQHAVVAASSMVKVSPDTDLKLYASLGCGLQTGAGTVLNSLGTTKGSSLAVWGVGPVGLAAVMAGVLAGAKTIIAIDLQQDRLTLAKELGATHTIDGRASDVVEQVQKLSGTNGVNFAVDCTGVPKVVENMVNSLCTRGRGCSVGAPKPGSTAAIDIFSHLQFGGEYIGCVEGDANPPQVSWRMFR
jgi:Zn-dependent alcohol dehydrogenase